MTSQDSAVDQLIEAYYRAPSADAEMAKAVRNEALSNRPQSSLVAARCVPVIEALELAGRWSDRFDDFKRHLAELVRRCHQVDQLGDVDTDPEAVFGVLDADADGIDIDNFDPDELRRARIGKPGRPSAAQAFLNKLAFEDDADTSLTELRSTITCLIQRSDHFQATALFATPAGHGLPLGVNVRRTDGDAISGFSDADHDMKLQAAAVLSSVYGSQGVAWGLEWEVTFGGSSIGLALWIASQVDRGNLKTDPLLASTGRIDAAGAVRHVGGVTAKVQAALAAGFRRILVPADDEDEAKAAAADIADTTVLGVANVADVPRLLQTASGAVPIGFDGAIRFARKLLPLYGLDLVGERTLGNGYRLEVADAVGKAGIDVFSGRNGTVAKAGAGSASNAVERLIQEHFPKSRIEKRDSVTRVVAADDRRQRLVKLLEQAGAEYLAPTNQYELWRYRLVDGPSKAVIVAYTTDKVVVNAGQAPAHDAVTTILDSVLAGLSGLPDSPPREPRITAPPPAIESAHIGTDEAGKGDYFGPLICGACYLDAEVADVLRALGVMDSKKLSDKKIRFLAGEIRRALPGRFAVIVIQPLRYNSLYAELRTEGKNLNSMVAWGHARGIKNLVVDHKIDAEYVVIDKFADERYMRDLLARDSRTRDLPLDQRIKAESDIAVAAASILARDAFVNWLDEQSAKLGLPLPKGASDTVIAAAKKIVAAHGPDKLGQYAKLSFKTTQKVMG